MRTVKLLVLSLARARSFPQLSSRAPGTPVSPPLPRLLPSAGHPCSEPGGMPSAPEMTATPRHPLLPSSLRRHLAADAGTSHPAPVPLLASSRPLFWGPGPRSAVVLLLLLLALLGIPPASAEHPRWQRPAQGEVVREYQAPPAPWAAGHRGLDLALPAGGAVRAPADGVVSFSGIVVNRGVLSIDHGAGYVSSFEPVESDLVVGDLLSAGEVVAVLSTYDDASHHCTAVHSTDSPCLHWGVRHYGEYINPLLMLGELEPSVLLPLSRGGSRGEGAV